MRSRTRWSASIAAEGQALHKAALGTGRVQFVRHLAQGRAQRAVARDLGDGGGVVGQGAEGPRQGLRLGGVRQGRCPAAGKGVCEPWISLPE